MKGIDRYGGDIDTIDNVSNYSECNKRCNLKKDCFVWTYLEGSCYVKNENTFRTNRSNVIGGIKDCKSDRQEGDPSVFSMILKDDFIIIIKRTYKV